MSRKVKASKPAISSGIQVSSFEEALMTVKSAYSHHLGELSVSAVGVDGLEEDACGEKVDDSETCCIFSAILEKRPLELEG